MATETTSLDDIWQRYQAANLDTKLDLLREALMVAIPHMRDAGENPRILHELLLELERKKDGASKGVLDPIPPDNRPRDFAAHLKKRNASLAVQIHFLLGKKLGEGCELVSAEVGVAASTIKRWRYNKPLDYEETAIFYQNLILEEHGYKTGELYLKKMLQIHLEYAK